MHRKHLAIISLITFVVGCAQYRPEPISAPLQANALDNRRLDDARLQAFIAASLADSAPDRAQWNLAKLTLAALYYHPDIAVARAKLARARAGAITAGQYPNP